jgi:hypothetical protein
MNDQFKTVISVMRGMTRFGYGFHLCLFLFLGTHIPLQAQVTEQESKERAPSLKEGIPQVYIDCSSCDYNHIRREINFVTYVRDQEMADIHVFITDEGTGGGGREYEFSFIGQRDFEGTQYTLSHYIGRNATAEETREALNNYLTMGFASFMLQTPLGRNFSLNYNGNGGNVDNKQGINDPWDHWVFEIYAGSIELQMESNQNEFDSRWGFYADRVTDEWKVRIRPYFNYDRVEIEQSEGDQPVISSRKRHGLESYAIRSLSNHWSVGLFGTYLTEDERNYRHEASLNTGIEYSLFPYEQATRKAITFTYQVGYTYADYYEETIFGYTEQNLLNQQIQGAVSILKPWGTIETGLEGAHYFHNLDRRRVEFYGQISVRLIAGLSLGFQADYDVVRDQLSLPAQEASLEEVLLQQREQATNFSFSTSIALTYTFGSEFSNIVNTRF